MDSRGVAMADIARELGLSRSTVSFALNGRQDIQIPEETRNRVIAKAAEMGYRRHAGARSLAAQRTDFIGVVTDIGGGPFAGDILLGAQRAAWDRGKFLLVVGFAEDEQGTDRAVEMLLERRVEGLIFATQGHAELTIPSIAREVPVVLVHCTDAERELPSIVPDEHGGGYKAADHLLRLGHRRIAMINLARTALAAAPREQGFRDAHRDHGIEVDDGLMVEGDATAASGYDWARKLMGLDAPPTAIFCGNDRTAMGAFDAVKELGLRIPADVSVIGFDNQDLIAPYLHPPLTSVGLPFRAMGEAAVTAIVEAAAGKPVGSLTIGCPLVERASVR